MRYNMKWALVAIVLLTVWLLIQQLYSAKQITETQAESLKELQDRASSFAALRKRWSKKGERERVLRKLQSIKRFDKRFNKGSHLVIVYENLNAKILNQLSYALFSSDALLVSVDISKDGERASMKVEMK